jgi:predicted permease
MLRLRLRSLFRSGRVEAELDEELRYHLEHLIDDHVAAGLSPAEARYRALREMGAIEPRREECRDARGLVLLDSLRQDLAYALRSLWKSPGFSGVALLSLAIGIGANTTIFTFVNAVLLTPLPFPDPGRLVVLYEHHLESADPLSVHPVNYVEWRARSRSFASLVLVQAPPLNVMGRGGAEQVSRLQATSELFDVFAVRPSLGRWFRPEETRPGQGQVVVLGYDFWQRWFAGDPGILGRQLIVPDGSLTIVGVGPPGFRIGLTEPGVFTPMTIDPANPAATGSRAFQCYGRLAPGVTAAAANAEMAVIASALRPQYRFDERMGVRVVDLHAFLARDARPGLRLLMAVVATVLGIACVNLAGLFMARGLSRRGEFAVRAALGASRGRIVRQLVIESLVLSAGGGALGLLIAYWATQGLATLAGGALTAETAAATGLDARCLLFTFAASAATALAFGLIPAREASQVDPQVALRDRARGGTADRRHHRVRRLLVVTEVALAVVLLVGAGLLLRTLSNLGRVDLGFRPAETMTAGLFLGVRPPETRSEVLERILDRVQAVPGVKAAGTIQFLPLRGVGCGTGFWREDHAADQDPLHSLPTDCALVSRGYFTAMGIPVVEGRPFDRGDRLDGRRVLVVNQSFARRYFPDGQVLGSRILVQSTNQALAEIVGVVGDVRQGLISDPAPTVFLLHAQTPGYITNLVVRASGSPLAIADAIGRAVHDVDPTQAISGVSTIEQDVARVLARPRLQAVLVACFAGVAVGLALIGIYGLLAYVVTLRTHEIGIRLALGASRRRVFMELFGQGALLVCAGVAAGLAASIGLRQVASTFVFGVTAGDPATYIIAAATFCGVSVAALVVPAVRAARVDPMRALRFE